MTYARRNVWHNDKSNAPTNANEFKLISASRSSSSDYVGLFSDEGKEAKGREMTKKRKCAQRKSQKRQRVEKSRFPFVFQHCRCSFESPVALNHIYYPSGNAVATIAKRILCDILSKQLRIISYYIFEHERKETHFFALFRN